MESQNDVGTTWEYFQKFIDESDEGSGNNSENSGTVADIKSAYIDMEGTSVAIKKLAEEDYEYLCVMEHYARGSGNTYVVSKDASYSYDWLASTAKQSDVASLTVKGCNFSRDGENKLQLDTAERLLHTYRSKHNFGTRLSLDDKNTFSEMGTKIYDYDMLIIRVDFDDGGWSAYTILFEDYDKELFSLSDVEGDPDKSEETYTVNLAEDDTVVNLEDFEKILEENVTKDVVINSNNGVSFTFYKGTMQKVEGKNEYDFTTTITRDYKEVEELLDNITASEFVSKIDFNYSGQLPAKAYVRFYVDKELAGKMLSYGEFKKGSTFTQIQAVRVDEEGYVTVEQDHCSSYLLLQSVDDIVKGDANGDKQVTLADAQVTLKAALKIIKTEEIDAVAADVDGKEGIALADAQMILKAALKIIKL